MIVHFLFHNICYRIKQTQNLLVSFEKFSDKLINMFEKCSISSSGSATSTRTSGILHSDTGSRLE